MGNLYDVLIDLGYEDVEEDFSGTYTRYIL